MKAMEKIFKALADRNRLRIIRMLEVKSMCVCEITEVLGIAQPSVSRHLALLRDAGLLVDEKTGIWTNYSLASETDDMIATLLQGIRRWGNDDTTILADRAKAITVDRARVCATL